MVADEAQEWNAIDGECPICAHKSWCQISSDHLVCIFINKHVGVYATRRDSDGAEYRLHRLAPPDGEAPITADQPTDATALVDVETQNAVYTAVLNELRLSPAHRDALVKRGLSPEEIGKDHRVLIRVTRHPKRQVFHPERVPSARLTKYNDRRANPRGRVPSNVWTISRVCGTFRERIGAFPTQLPVELLRRIVRTASDPGDLVLDPFSGSGTTGFACLELGCHYLGIELNGEYAETSRRRLERPPVSMSASTTEPDDGRPASR
jgi:site-specific DNA-methyltransferase (adenine-specific)